MKMLTNSELKQALFVLRAKGEPLSHETACRIADHIAALTALPEDVERDHEEVAKVYHHPYAREALSRLATAAARVPGLEETIRTLASILECEPTGEAVLAKLRAELRAVEEQEQQLITAESERDEWKKQAESNRAGWAEALSERDTAQARVLSLEVVLEETQREMESVSQAIADAGVRLHEDATEVDGIRRLAEERDAARQEVDALRKRLAMPGQEGA